MFFSPFDSRRLFGPRKKSWFLESTRAGFCYFLNLKKEVGCCWRRVLSSWDICFLKSEKDSTHRLFFPINRSSWTGQLSFLHFYVPFYALLLNLVELSINCARFHKQTTYWSSKNKFNNILTKQQISWNQGSIQSIFYTFPLVYCHDWIRKMNLVRFRVLIKILNTSLYFFEHRLKRTQTDSKPFASPSPPFINPFTFFFHFSNHFL